MGTPSNWFGGNKGGMPDAPDFSQAAMSGQSNPFGNVSWSTGPDGTPTMNTGFSGPMSTVFGNVANNMAQATSMDPATARNQAVNQNLDYGMSRLTPMFAQQNNAFNASMANAGLDPGSQSYDAANQQLGVKQSDMFNSVYNTALNAGNETQRTQMAQSMQPFAQAGMMQNWLPQGNAAAPFMGANAQYNAGKDRASANNAKKGQTMQGITDIAGSVMGVPKGK